AVLFPEAGGRALDARRRRPGAHARRTQRRHDALPQPHRRAEGAVSALTIVSLTTAQRDELFDPVRAIDGVELAHVDHRVSSEEISARRTGQPLPAPEPVLDAVRATLAWGGLVWGFLIPRDNPALAPRVRWFATPGTGIDHLGGIGVVEADIPITTVGGLFGALSAEHVFPGMLTCAKRLS